MTDLDRGIFGTPVTQVGDKGKDETDSGTLCDSKHEIWVYTTDFGNDGVVTPGEDNIVVSFVATDTSGTGCIGAILDGSLTFVTDPEEWRDTIGEGYDILNQRRKDCSGAGDCISDYAQWGVYSGIAGITTAGSYIGQGAVDGTKAVVGGLWSAGKAIGKATCFWCAEDYDSACVHDAETNYQPVGNEMRYTLQREFRTGVTESGQDCFDDFGGTIFHNSNGRGHKINISITCDGKQMYDTELAGTADRTTLGDNMRFDPTMKQFKITKPGVWKVTVKSLSSHAECATPNLDESWTINVPKPADWDESAPVIETQTEEVKEVMAKVDNQLEIIGFESGTDPLTVFAGIVVVGGLLTWGVLRALTSKSSDKEPEK